jgi:hypothetical protein
MQETLKAAKAMLQNVGVDTSGAKPKGGSFKDLLFYGYLAI